MSILYRLGQLLLGTPLETPARALYIRLSNSRGSRYERALGQIMRRVIRPDSNCIDIGAYRGAVLRDILRLAPQGRHVAFEPVARQFAYLQRSFRQPQVTLRPWALGEESGQTSFFHVSSRPTYSGLRRTQYPAADERVEEIAVEVRRLDEVLPADLPIHFIKIDVEGAEYHVLRGGLATIRRWRPVIVFEHGLISELYYQNSSGAVFDLLAEAGLAVALLDDWLARRPPLTREGFVGAVHTDHHYYFVAYPRQ